MRPRAGPHQRSDLAKAECEGGTFAPRDQPVTHA
jgi:hypothetical protein